ncbi:MAG: DsbA family protein [Thermoleophilaceae bacterium]
MERPRFYYDISSVYAYLAAERIGSLIPEADWRPIYVFGLRKLNGRVAWILTDEREPRMREIEQRVQRYGLPPISWPTTLPENMVGLGRAAVVAKRLGREREFSLAAMRALYADGADPSTPEELARLARTAQLDERELLAGIADDAVKDELRAATDEAHALGVPGVPAVVVDGEVFWGDDRLDEAARAAGAAR